MSNCHVSPQSALQPVTLPSGLVMPNALVKAAMYEHMAPLFGGLPNANHLALYSLWSQGGWGMIITGNVQVSRDHLTLGRDMVIPKTVTSDALRSYTALALAMRPASEQYNRESHGSSKPRTLVIMQLSHAGRQSPIVLGGRLPFIPPFAPSALGIGRDESSSAHLGWFAKLVFKIGFQTPRAMSVQDIDHVVNRFVLGAKLADDAGFDGIELHASHGYLLAQFISPKSNIRGDDYGARYPLHLLQRIVTAIRKVLPRPFVLGIKLSSSDYVGAGSLYNARAEEEAKNRALAHVADIAAWDLADFIEVSGGDYENPEFMATSRQAFFARFAREARDVIHAQASSSPQHPLVLLTGGMRSPEAFENALSHGHADLVGIGRGSVLAPRLPLFLRKLSSAEDVDGENDEVARELSFRQPTLSYADTTLIRVAVSTLRGLGILPLPTLIGAGASMAWYVVTMSRISRGDGINYQMGGIRVVLTMWIPELKAILFSCLAICFCFIYLR